jgi:hypothetical protein
MLPGIKMSGGVEGYFLFFWRETTGAVGSGEWEQGHLLHPGREEDVQMANQF